MCSGGFYASCLAGWFALARELMCAGNAIVLKCMRVFVMICAGTQHSKNLPDLKTGGHARWSRKKLRLKGAGCFGYVNVDSTNDNEDYN